MMKKTLLVIPTTIAFLLSGCNITDSISPLGPQAQYLTDPDFGLIDNCHGELMSLKQSPSEADRFWMENNLPKGTTKYVCKNEKAYLPNQVTDCQGNNISQQAGGVEAFKAKNQLVKTGNLKFICVNGKAQQWHK